MKRFPENGRHGSALVICLCAIALLSLTVLGLVQFADLDLKEIAMKEKDFRARQLAESGIAIGLYPDLEKDDPVLHQQISPSESFDVDLQSEGARININALLLQKQEDVLRALLKKWGLKPADQDTIIDSLLDWVDADTLEHLHGAEEKYYTLQGMKGFPPNRPFQDLDEMDLVKGMDVLDKIKPDWKDSFTILSDGRLDLNEASADLIEAVCGVSDMAAKTFTDRRLGPDGKPDTNDDFKYTSLSEVRTALGLSEKAFAVVEKRVNLKSEYRRIESTGTVGSYQRRLAVVIRLNVSPVQYLTWIEY